MTSPTIIALIGPKGCGKSTLAAQLPSTDFIRTPFASPLKAMLRTLLSIQHVTPDEIDAMLNGPLKETPTDWLAGRTPRHAMQTLGTEWRDLIDRELWTKIWRNVATANIDMGYSVIVDDMRFLHEAEAVRSLGGRIFRIHREGQPSSTDPHPSEHEWLSIEPDGMIVNYPDRPEAMLTQFIDFLPGILS